MMRCPKCGFEQSDEHAECIKCGIIYEKYFKWQASAAELNDSTAVAEESVSYGKQILNLFLHVEPKINPLIFYGRAAFFLVILIWGWSLILTPMETNAVGRSFWHMVNLPFHEAGHVFFRFFGRFMTSLGGSLGQVLMPLICLTVFILKTRDAFAAAFCLWWTGENFMDMAPYINDARSLSLPLLGGNTGRTSPYGFHDWEYLLTESGLLRYDHLLAGLSYGLGIVLMLISFAWAGYLLFKQYQNLSATTYD